MAAFVDRWSQTQPLLTKPRAALRYLPMVPFLLLVPYTVGVIVVVLVAVVLNALGVRDGWHPRSVDIAGRVVLGALALIALPSFVVAIADIIDRSP